MQTSGLVLDVYDDYSGEVVRSIWPNHEALPDNVKQASALSSEQRQSLPDDVFALVMLNNGEKLRKYACTDPGNTVLSVCYFLKNAHKLPVEAQHIAAENLKKASAWYDLPVPEPLEKIALGLGTALMAAPVISGTHRQIKDNMAATRALEGAGSPVVTPQERASLLSKQAETSGTQLMPNQPPADPTPIKSKTVVLKTAGIGHLVAHKGSDVPPDVVHPPTHEQPDKHPQAGHLRPHVDVSNKTPPVLVQEKKASLYALPSQQKYPLDSYQQVKVASEYFDTYCKHMSPPTRHEYAVNLVKRADALAISVSTPARKYGSEDFAPEHEIKAAFDMRRNELQDKPDALALLDRVERVARQRMWKEASDGGLPQEFDAKQVCDILAEFDKVAGLDHHYDRTIPDPFFSIFGFEKSAAPEAGANWSEVVGNDMVTREDLERLAKVGAFSVKTTFGGDFQEKFLKDPVGAYKSVPLPMRKMLMRMANSTQPGVERTYY